MVKSLTVDHGPGSPSCIARTCQYYPKEVENKPLQDMPAVTSAFVTLLLKSLVVEYCTRKPSGVQSESPRDQESVTGQDNSLTLVDENGKVVDTPPVDQGPDHRQGPY